MHYFSNKCLKIFKHRGHSSSFSDLLTFDLGDLKLRDLAKLEFFKLIMMKSNLKIISYDVISAKSSF